MADYTNYTNKEMQAVTIAKQIKNGQVVTVGTGLPLIGASVAKRVYAPDCHIIVESGLMDCSPVEVPRSVGDLRFMAHCGTIWPNVRFVGFEINEYLHKENRLIAFIGGAQIDPYGNVNSTSIGDYHHPKTRFTGSGGANGIATYSNTIIMMQHEKRRFMDKIDYVTSPGWIDGPGGRERLGLPGEVGPQMVVTDAGSSNSTKRPRECTWLDIIRPLPPKTSLKIRALKSTFPALLNWKLRNRPLSN